MFAMFQESLTTIGGALALIVLSVACMLALFDAFANRELVLSSALTSGVVAFFFAGALVLNTVFGFVNLSGDDAEKPRFGESSISGKVSEVNKVSVTLELNDETTEIEGYRASVGGEEVIVNAVDFDDFDGKEVSLNCQNISGTTLCHVDNE